MVRLFYLLTFLLFPYGSYSGEICPIYYWPSEVKNLEKVAMDMRQHLVGQEMDKFSRMVGICYNRDPKGLAEKTWCEQKRDQNIENVFKTMGTIKKLCANVKKYLVEDKLPNSKKDPSPYCQYANCGEGQIVGACLAYHFGYSPEEIRLCDSEHDHAWAMIPEKGGKNTFCLLDRWNSFRCGVKFNGKQLEQNVWTGDVIVPGKSKFKFSKTTCSSLSQYDFSP